MASVFIDPDADRFAASGMAGRQGFEPRFNGPEPFVLPLDDRPTLGADDDSQGPLDCQPSINPPPA